MQRVFAIRLTAKSLCVIRLKKICSNTVKNRFTDTRLIRTPYYHGQFPLSLGKESPCVFSTFNPLNTETFCGPLSVRMVCDCSQTLLRKC